VATEIRGIILRLRGWKARPSGDQGVHFNGSVCSHSIKQYNQTWFGSVGLNHPGNGEAVAFCGVHFFGINAGGGILRHH
jgi:hypothetical protein